MIRVDNLGVQKDGPIYRIAEIVTPQGQYITWPEVYEIADAAYAAIRKFKEEEKAKQEEEASRAEALAEYPAHRAKQQQQEEQDECPHDEHDHGICLDCGKDIFDDIVGAAEFRRDELNDRL